MADNGDIIFRPLRDADCFPLNDWMRQLGWPTARTDEEVERDPIYRLRGAVSIAAVDSTSGTFLGVASYFLQRPNYAHFALYIVHPDYRGKGIGKLLWDKAFEEIGDRNVGICSYEMTEKYRTKAGFKVVGNTVIRYYVPETELIDALQLHQQASSSVTQQSAIKEATSQEDRDQIVQFMKDIENRSERFAEDDLTIGNLHPPFQHTLIAVDSKGTTVGWGSIGLLEGGVDRVAPLFAHNDEIFLLVLLALLQTFGRGDEHRVFLSVSSHKRVALNFVRDVPGARKIVELHQSFTKYREYPNSYLEHFYCF